MSRKNRKSTTQWIEFDLTGTDRGSKVQSLFAERQGLDLYEIWDQGYSITFLLNVRNPSRSMYILENDIERIWLNHRYKETNQTYHDTISFY